MNTLETLYYKKKFGYQGSVKEGVILFFGKNQSVKLEKEDLKVLLNTFSGKTVPIGASRTNPPIGSLGDWLMKNITKVAIASYLAPVLITEGYAQKIDNFSIKFN
ncbi:hypothetical protein D1B31_02055 [Neobacillus notoginsengisoli]|uniref:Uncharacterized protein n=1 Tax=Neobacillus notoginsengisoli TaxID=1578198 RepID=A0A417Z0A7_9BACI|nr:hypothetical protein [Neobacillus notoginsengisoli]RHW43466.1 hypothetical protein D1B31_02055 [Neobacillus notoginsengisoli]